MCLPNGSWLGRFSKLAVAVPAKQDRVASSSRRMTFIRAQVGTMSLTHHVKMKRQQPECVRLGPFAEAIWGFLPHGA